MPRFHWKKSAEKKRREKEELEEHQARGESERGPYAGGVENSLTYDTTSHNFLLLMEQTSLSRRSVKLGAL